MLFRSDLSEDNLHECQISGDETKEIAQLEEQNDCKKEEVYEVEATTTNAETLLDLNKPYEEMSVGELQASVLAKLAANGPVTEQMRHDVEVNVYRDSLLNWVKSFR